MARTPPDRRPMTDTDELIRQYELDSSSAYGMLEHELLALLGALGELEPIIDALMVLGNQSKRARAEAIGCRESDFDGQD